LLTSCQNRRSSWKLAFLLPGQEKFAKVNSTECQDSLRSWIYAVATTLLKVLQVNSTEWPDMGKVRDF
jgi:hypothetical protein